MNIPLSLPEDQPVLLLDRTHDLTHQDVLYHFALDELLCKLTGDGGPAICHLWRHPRAFVMGVRDSRLPYAPQGEAMLRSLGYDTAVRHSGGAAVPLDAGVVNLSLILPFSSAGPAPDFHQDFEVMVELIREALRGTGQNVDTGEIAGAFCPGTFDLSIDGLKFCGIAQRRQRKAFIIQAFIIAEGSGSERARLVRSFYDIAAAGADPKQYPLVEANSTASLEELTSIGTDQNTAHTFITTVKEVIRSWQSGKELTEAASRFTMPGSEEIRNMAEQMRQRYNLN
ncbi:lipoyl protein ligase domain-containing protein [Paenibacillus sp. MDMC362]|uniref:lipoate--protein ligase family protein n=1 Tax=Paenibacillus sp. MDMC362 TaxID=2977365 RepID=UPI000DC56C07|nr:lipoate--protein ligase family protein [Paenibacillus sp. MDMC362]RAR44287.1 lipoate--protein ligase family protein [Paenibacillus sp. MDMC362]